MVLVSEGRAEESHDAVAQDLVHGTLVAMDRFHHLLEHAVQDVTGVFGITIGQQFHGALEVGEEHGDLLALALERRA